MQQQPEAGVPAATAAAGGAEQQLLVPGEPAFLPQSSPASHGDCAQVSTPQHSAFVSPAAASAAHEEEAEAAGALQQSQIRPIQQLLPAQQHEEQQQPSASAGTAATFLGADLQPQPCLQQWLIVSSSGAGSSSSIGMLYAAATAGPSISPLQAGPPLEGAASAPASSLNSTAAAGDAGSSLGAAAMASTSGTTGVSSSAISRTSSSSSAAMQLGLVGSSGDNGQALSNLLAELGISMESLQRLFTAGFAEEFEQPVWMVVNLQVCRWLGVLHIRVKQRHLLAHRPAARKLYIHAWLHLLLLPLLSAAVVEAVHKLALSSHIDHI
jgi:hypothetical protein